MWNSPSMETWVCQTSPRLEKKISNISLIWKDSDLIKS